MMPTRSHVVALAAGAIGPARAAARPCTSWGPVPPHIAGGKMVAPAVAVADRERWPLAPDVPTLAEPGIRDAEVGAWHGLWRPRAPAPNSLARWPRT
ncbi:MAG: hypothetical protein JWP65_68 [Ramlibacter sp.]|uniref:tripartite tricarboxylate transporter substrate-binding protein n=1 Tax=Ramlibacter sp. TaxID=1917967 RepID=UPI002625C2F8|nr:tripartite tricarboxylate transporter substrate-binding protein [Ramlibacter sp.]MDB5749647.1 hypothetical protein [Ramlibacter sp.]